MYILISYLTTLILPPQPTQTQWAKVFYIAAGVYIFCATFYLCFASGRRQEWDNPSEDEAIAKKKANKKLAKEAASNQAETTH